VAPINETDTVKVHFSKKDNSFVTVLGGGINIGSAGSRGVRADFRVYIGSNSMNTFVDATPTFVTAPNATSLTLASDTTPSLQLSNNQILGRQNLSAPAQTDFQTFEGTGREIRTTFTVGYYFRF